MNTNEQILKALDFRFACKEFDTTKRVSENDFHTILESARLAPSSFGFEPWKLVVLDNQELREKIKPFCWGAGKQLETAHHFVILLARSGRDMKHDSEYIKKTMEDLHKSPPDVVVTRLERLKRFQEEGFNLHNEELLSEWACRQVYITLGNMMMSASLLDIDSCPIEGFDRKKVEDVLVEEHVLEKEHFGVVCMVAFGYRVSDPTRKRSRRAMNEIVQMVK